VHPPNTSTTFLVACILNFHFSIDIYINYPSLEVLISNSINLRLGSLGLGDISLRVRLAEELSQLVDVFFCRVVLYQLRSFRWQFHESPLERVLAMPFITVPVRREFVVDGARVCSFHKTLDLAFMSATIIWLLLF
jgi:hypothetical protein